MVSFPVCKINLGLNVLRKRADGYHDLATCFYPVPWCDVLEIVPAPHFSFQVSGLSVPGPDSSNLCVRAYDLLRRDFELEPVAIHLLKIVPVGAGLGGGSSDAAYTLKTLNALFELSIPAPVLRAYAAELGSDCAFFIDSKPAFGEGRGEVLSDINLTLRGKYIVIIKPAVSINTGVAFANVSTHPPSMDLKSILENQPLEEWRHSVANDFEEYVFREYPVVGELRQVLYDAGAQFASLSGSGSSVFGIFGSEVDLKDRFQSVEYWSGYLT